MLTTVNVDPAGNPVALTVMVLLVSASVGLIDRENGPEFWQILKWVLSFRVPPVDVDPDMIPVGGISVHVKTRNVISR